MKKQSYIQPKVIALSFKAECGFAQSDFTVSSTMSKAGETFGWSDGAGENTNDFWSN